MSKESAFPQISTAPGYHRISNYHDAQPYTDVSSAGGLTIRDWFAGQVLAGQWTLRESEAAHITQPAARDMAESAYRIADAMMKARENT